MYNGVNIEEERTVKIEKTKKFRWRGSNIFSVEDENNIYYVLMCKQKKSDRYLAFTKSIPKVGRRINCTRVMTNYTTWCEQDIHTHNVRSIKQITNDLYKVKSGHTYYMLKV